jgi:D-alanyl-D-alanine carboxypeptidase/D-alanyl-D-alanine-endopeptidase (penicillin-binding protein 4)
VRWNRIALVLVGVALVATLATRVGLSLRHRGGDLAAAPSPLPSATPAPGPTIKPAPPWTSAQRAALESRFANIFAAPVFEHAGLTILAQDGTQLFVRRERIPMTPASTLKLVVAATALERLGPYYRFTTSFASDGTVDERGVLHGSLWFVGSGDPLLVSNDVRGGVGTLARAGIRRIDGSLEVDDFAFSGPELNPHWDPDDLEEGYAPPTSAVSLDQDTVEFHVAPSSPGSPALVTIEPPNARVTFSGSIGTASEGADSDLTIDRAHVPQAFGGADVTDPANAFVLDGHIAYGEMQKYWKPVRDVAHYAGGAVIGMLGERGIDVVPEPGRSRVPPGARVLWAHRSQPLWSILDEMLVHSNNHSAEQLLRSVGRGAGRGSDGDGVAAERATLADLGVPTVGFNVHDGSGLSPGDRIPSLTLARLLAAELARPAGGFLLGAMPRPGLEGTVKYHQLTTALGRVRAKSGHIGGVNGLAGVVRTAHHGLVTFAFLVNDPNADADAVTNGQDAAMDALATL